MKNSAFGLLRSLHETMALEIQFQQLGTIICETLQDSWKLFVSILSFPDGLEVTRDLQRFFCRGPEMNAFAVYTYVQKILFELSQGGKGRPIKGNSSCFVIAFS